MRWQRACACTSFCGFLRERGGKRGGGGHRRVCRTLRAQGNPDSAPRSRARRLAGGRLLARASGAHWRMGARAHWHGPVRVEDDDCVCGDEVDAHATRSSAEEEEESPGVRRAEAVDGCLALVTRHGAVQPLVLKPTAGREAGGRGGGGGDVFKGDKERVVVLFCKKEGAGGREEGAASGGRDATRRASCVLRGSHAAAQRSTVCTAQRSTVCTAQRSTVCTAQRSTVCTALRSTVCTAQRSRVCTARTAGARNLRSGRGGP